METGLRCPRSPEEEQSANAAEFSGVAGDENENAGKGGGGGHGLGQLLDGEAIESVGFRVEAF